MKISKLLTVTALAVLTTFSSMAAMAADKLRIASEGAYAPFNMINEQGELIGFDIDIAKALCAEMQVECEIVAQDWDGIIPGLMGRKYDAIIASMSITKERLRVVDFTDRYYSNVFAFVVAKDKALETTKEGLKGLTVGAQRATWAGQYLEDELADEVNVKLYGTQGNAYLDLASGRLDALLSDKFPAYNWLQSEEGQGFEFRGEELDMGDQVAIAVRKRDPLKEKLNAAIKAIVENGTYAEINARYFPFSIY
ncbi:amino acid ABC transporter substrate-binding protein (PAAT family) [Marinobacterium halophilum]|uniref:Amino acid ABC transporter substrate-binding protein (PAAT family) n=1 Tax=Marinobacterium halophilum TaxID=267374 RepID=A0A2P8F307_9GAMM|nr:ABC transporter substrate-binding protein [Marinobacterium halophilum]PSL16099.1 amino acid ABC transporter substrate-binding protein (PAAT family) [Marinobacterium halophilum]